MKNMKYSDIWVGMFGAIALFYIVLNCLKLIFVCLQMYKLNFEDWNHFSLRSIWNCCSFTGLGLSKTKSTVLWTPSPQQAGDRRARASDILERLDKSRLHWHFLSLSNRFEKTFQSKFCCLSLACGLVSPTQECYKNILRKQTMELYRLQQASEKVALMISNNKCWQN